MCRLIVIQKKLGEIADRISMQNLPPNPLMATGEAPPPLLNHQFLPLYPVIVDSGGNQHVSFTSQLPTLTNSIPPTHDVS